MCHVNLKYTAEIAIAVTPHDAAMAVILYVDCSLQQMPSDKQHSLPCSQNKEERIGAFPRTVI